MAKLFRRSAAVKIAFPIGGSLKNFGAEVLEIRDLRFQFSVKKSLVKEPNTAEVTISNLSAQHRAALQDRGLRVTLSAGYESTESVVFVGDVRDTESTQEGSTWLTKIQLGDGERGYRWGRTSESFRKGVRITEVLQKVADQMELDSTAVRNVEALQGRQFVAGYVAHGRASRELDRILKGFGLEWSIQDGQLQVLSPEAVTPETVIELSASSGLVGSPTLNTPSGEAVHVDPFTGKVQKSTSKGRPILKAKSLLQPEIRPGRRVSVDSITGIKGVFRCTRVEHSGDTHSGEWYTQIEATTVQ